MKNGFTHCHAAQAALGVFLVIITGASCKGGSQSPSPPPHQHGQGSQVAGSTGQNEVWTCPMHPQIRKDQPGQCPVCGMNLVKMKSGEQGPAQPAPAPSASPHVDLAAPPGHAAFDLGSEMRQMIGVKTAGVEKKPMFKEILAAGRLAYDPELYTAQNEYVQARLQLDRVKNSPVPDVRQSAKRMMESARLRLKILGLSDEQIQSLSRSDAGGTTEANLLLHRPGQDLWIYADIYEMDLPHLRSGLSAEISAGFLGAKRLAGKVVSVDRVLNPTTRTAKARILVNQAQTALRPESYVDVSIYAPLGEQLTIPFDAVFDTGERAWVFVVKGEGRFEPRAIEIKFRAGDAVAVASGLGEGERIVTSGNFLIDSESRLKGVAAEAGKGSAGAPQTKPSCPKGQHWDAPMKMCMPDVGG